MSEALLDEGRVEAATLELGRRLMSRRRRGGGLFGGSRWNQRIVEWALSDPDFKTQLFRFVDVFPALAGTEDVARHIAEYFDGSAPPLIEAGVGLAPKLPGGRAVEASLARRTITRMAHQFIVGESPEAALAELGRLREAGVASTVDLLGEKTLTAAEADRYAARVRDLITVLASDARTRPPDPLLDSDDLGPLPQANVSVKLSALAPHLAPLTASRGEEESITRLRPLLLLARDRDVHLHVDMEHADLKSLTLRIVSDLLDDPDVASLSAGVVIQAYLRDSFADLEAVCARSAARVAAGGLPLTVRLVKGAYWDSETITARSAGWVPPVYERKVETDANFERCVRLLHRHHGTVRAAFGTHNLRSIAYAVSSARQLGIPDTGYEIQLLYGMAEQVHVAVRDEGLRLRVYCPVGELVAGMAYLVRRLLENTSNEGFVRLAGELGGKGAELLERPVAELDVADTSPQRSVVP